MASTASTLTWRLDEQGHRHDVGQRGGIEPLPGESGTEAHAVIRGHYEQGAIVEALRPQLRQEAADDGVHELHLHEMPLVALGDRPFLGTPSFARDAEQARLRRELLARAQVDVRLVREECVQEVQRWLRVTVVNRVEESGDGRAAIVVARLHPAPLPRVGPRKVLPVVGQRGQ